MTTNIQRALWLGAICSLLLISSIGVALAVGEAISRYNLSGSGGGRVIGSQASLRSAFGQPVAGVVANNSIALCTGFACGMGVAVDDSISGLSATSNSPTELGNVTQFNATVATGENVLYSWSFGDGATGSGPSPVHVYGAPGTYTASVTASNGAGSASATTQVEITGAGTTHTIDVVNFAFQPDPLTIRVGDTVTWVRQEGFHNVVADDGSFNSGPPSTTWSEYSHTFTSAGSFAYYCEIHGGPGGVGMAGTIIVETGDDQPISGLIAQNDGPTALGNATDFNATVSAGSSVQYAWDFGDGTSGTGATPRHLYATAGTYTATVTATNGAGSVQATTIVEVAHAVVEVINFAFAPDPVTIPAGGDVLWVRREGFHNVVADDGTFSSGPPSSAWTTYRRTFETVGSYPYYCEAHGAPGGNGMSGTVNVTDAPAQSARVWLPIVRK